MTPVLPLCLVDTNVLLRYADSIDPSHQIARRAVQRLRVGHSLCTTSQNLIESWNVMTRPADRNGFGYETSEAQAGLTRIESVFPRLQDPPDLYERWLKLVDSFGVRGVQVHDARIVAVMLAHEIRTVLTFDAGDFGRYTDLDIEAVLPQDA